MNTKGVVMNLRKIVDQHAADGITTGNTYGSLDAGIAVMKYRAQKQKYYKEEGKTFEQAIKLAQQDVVKKYGKPQPIK